MRESLEDLIRRRLTENRQSQGELAKQAGISRQALVKILSGDVRDPRISTVISLARALHMAPFELLRAWLVSSGERGALSKEESSGDRISFVGWENWPNGLIVAPNAKIEKRWTVQNSGDEIWVGRQMRCLTLTGNEAPSLTPSVCVFDLPPIVIGSRYEFAMEFTCPPIPGLFASYWKMTDREGTFCFPDLPPLECVVTVVDF